MTVEQFIQTLLSGGAGAALCALLFWQNLQAEKQNRFERERYIKKLEDEAKELRDRLSESERPTRPIRYPAKKG